MGRHVHASLSFSFFSSSLPNIYIEREMGCNEYLLKYLLNMPRDGISLTHTYTCVYTKTHEQTVTKGRD